MNTPNHPSNISSDRPVDPGDLKIMPETMLSPGEMLNLSVELLANFEEKYPEIGAIPVEIYPEAEGFNSQLEGLRIYTPGVGDRPLFDPTKRPATKDQTPENTPPKDFATWFVQCFGKTVTMRARALHELPEPEDLQHKKVPRLVREFLTAKDSDAKTYAMLNLSKVIAHNTGLEIDDERTVQVISAHIWLINKLSAVIAQVEAR